MQEWMDIAPKNVEINVATIIGDGFYYRKNNRAEA
jgi:hypothetical protein